MTSRERDDTTFHLQTEPSYKKQKTLAEKCRGELPQTQSREALTGMLRVRISPKALCLPIMSVSVRKWQCVDVKVADMKQDCKPQVIAMDNWQAHQTGTMEANPD